MGGGHLFHSGDGDMRVLLSEVQQRGGLGLQVLEPDDPAAVITNRGAQARKLAGRAPGDGAAEAVADNADLAAFLGDRDRRGDIAQHLLAVDLAHYRNAALSRLRVVADVELRLDMLEDAGRYGEIALGCEPVRDRPNVRIDAKNFLDPDDP